MGVRRRIDDATGGVEQHCAAGGGLELDGVMEQTPFDYERAGLHKDVQGVDLPRAKGKLHMRPLEKLPGTKANMHKGHARECLVTKVRIMPLFLFCFDGATTMAATGVRRTGDAATRLRPQGGSSIWSEAEREAAARA